MWDGSQIRITKKGKKYQQEGKETHVFYFNNAKKKKMD